MSCSPDKVKDLFFGELGAAERQEVQGHLTACAACQEQMELLHGTRAALMMVPDEEPPRRIAFVSDKVFEPSWWQRMWASGPQLGFSAAAMLALAILVHGFLVRSPSPAAATAQPSAAAIVPVSGRPAPVEEEIARRVREEVAKAVAESEARQSAQVLELVNTRLRQASSRNSEDLVLIREYLERVEKRNAVMARRVLYE